MTMMTMNVSLKAVFFPIVSIGVGAIKLNIYDPRRRQEVLEEFEPTTFWLAGRYLNH